MPLHRAPSPAARRLFLRPDPPGISRPAALLALLGLAACTPGDDAGATGEARADLPVQLLESPPPEGSGEPFLSSSGDGILMSWIEPAAEGGHQVRFARYTPRGWSSPGTVASGEGFFVNWADFPSIAEVDGVLVAHWLQRGAAGGYDYGVRVRRSTDGGGTWSEPWTPHEDGTPTEHGFVSFFPAPAGGVGLVWLDGRRYARGPEGDPATEEMTLRSRLLDPGGRPGPEVLVDDRICDCCQTDAAVTARGPVVVYRDRSPDEVRDIRLARLEEDGWTEGSLVHADGWTIAACPVNGPAVAAAGESVVVAWFTAADDQPRVRAAFSSDAGDVFEAPLRVDGGAPIGRVDVVLLADGSAAVSWLERTGEGAEIRIRRVGADGRTGPPATVATTTAARAAGFPRMAPLDGGELLLAWTDVRDDGSRVRVARLGTPPW